jgi:deoxyribodipyrimidine photolyase-related protein
MNSLYWDFFARQRHVLGNNPRLGIVYKQLDKMDQNSLSNLQEQAVQWRERIEQI